MNPRPIFVAYPYKAFLKGPYRECFTSLENQFEIKFTFADDKISNRHIFEKIKDQISEATFGVYEISCWNANVALELGYAVGLGKPYVILFNPTKSGKKDVPADLSGVDRLEWRSYADLKKQLVRMLRAELADVKHGSAIHLQHALTRQYLSSSGEKYKHQGGSGSVLVACVSKMTRQTEWIVERTASSNAGVNAQAIRDGDIVRLCHRTTGLYLWSCKDFSSPVESQQEVGLQASAGGDGTEWKIEIDSASTWTKWDLVRLIHVKSGRPLHSHDRQVKPNVQEVTCFPGSDDNDFWRLRD